MARVSKAVLVMAAIAMLSIGGLSTAGLADVGLPPATTTSGETTATESTTEEDGDLPPEVDQEQLTKLRGQVVRYRRQTCYWRRYAFQKCAKAVYEERREIEASSLQQLVRTWKVKVLRAKRYALSFKYADRYLPPWQARIIGQRLAKLYGWVGQQWSCLNKLWGKLESGWDALRKNRQGSGAYGIPQALPDNKMAKMGARWKYSVLVQIKWGLWYIKTHRYFHSPCEALSYHYRFNSY